ncbi:MAG: triple tyrosine motif-containing protein [Parabacteroides sp.]
MKCSVNLTYSDDLQKYNYRLSPAQSNWLTINEGEKVSYANLPQGKYVFEVQSIMADGSSGYLTSMDINILPHWYEAIWFRLLIIITIGFIIYYLMRRVKKEQARLRHEELVKAMKLSCLPIWNVRKRSKSTGNAVISLRTSLTNFVRL